MAYTDRIKLAGAHNVRDLGGYKATDGSTVKMKRFVRADGLQELTDEDIKKLLDYGISIDIDLRGTDEVNRTVDKLAAIDQVQYVNVNLLEHLGDVFDATNMPKSLGDMYVGTLKVGQDYFKQIFELMIAKNNSTILFHCSAGKDRTGMIAAMLLLLAGVDEKTIIEDYAVSAQYLSPIMDQFSTENDANLAHFLNSDSDNIKLFIDAINQEYGGIANYLELIGLSKEQVNRLRSSLF